MLPEHGHSQKPELQKTGLHLDECTTGYECFSRRAAREAYVLQIAATRAAALSVSRPSTWIVMSGSPARDKTVSPLNGDQVIAQYRGGYQRASGNSGGLPHPVSMQPVHVAFGPAHYLA